MFKISKSIQQRVAREMWPPTANQVRSSFVVVGKAYSLSDQISNAWKRLDLPRQHTGGRHEVAQANQSPVTDWLVAAPTVATSALIGGAI